MVVACLVVETMVPLVDAGFLSVVCLAAEAVGEGPGGWPVGGPSEADGWRSV